MATYTKTIWNPGDLITSEKMNKIEDQLELITPSAINNAAVYNFLDNSNFIIAQVGYGGYQGTERYACDRWRNDYGFGTFTKTENGIQVTYNTNHSYMVQRLSPEVITYLNGKKITFAMCLADGDIYIQSATYSSDTTVIGTQYKNVHISVGPTVDLVVMEGSAIICWAALYEGEYTADTLPVYIPKGYATELAECQKYYKLPVYNLLDNSDFRQPYFIAQAGFNGTHGNIAYVGDRWIASGGNDYGGAASIDDDGITVKGYGMYQFIPNINKTKTYTIACWKADGDVIVHSGTFGQSFGDRYGDGVYAEIDSATGQPYVQFGFVNLKIRHAALYEGVYTAETLPAYVPKGYAVELAECQRYFERIGKQKEGTTLYSSSMLLAVSDDGNFRLLQGYKQIKRLTSPTILIDGASEGQTASLRDSSNNLRASGTVRLWNNFYPDRLNSITLDGATTTTGHIYEAYIDICADL